MVIQFLQKNIFFSFQMSLQLVSKKILLGCFELWKIWIKLGKWKWLFTTPLISPTPTKSRWENRTLIASLISVGPDFAPAQSNETSTLFGKGRAWKIYKILIFQKDRIILWSSNVIFTHFPFQLIFKPGKRTFYFDIEDLYHNLVITLFDQDQSGEDDFLGRICLPIQDIQDGKKERIDKLFTELNLPQSYLKLSKI